MDAQELKPVGSDGDFHLRVGTFITVGFMPTEFPRLFDVLYEHVSYLPKPIYVQSGELKKHKFFEICDSVESYFSEEIMINLISSASVVISHAGVGSIKKANGFRKIPIIIPRRAKFGEHIDDHQLELGVMMQDLGLVKMISSDIEGRDFKEIIQSIINKDKSSFGLLSTENPILSIDDDVLAVSSVGGHRAEISKIIEVNSGSSYIRMTDEDCHEVRNGGILRFPSCNKRYSIPLRIIQAAIFLMKNRNVKTIVTTGAGVGAVFVLAGFLLRRKTIAIESMTRIEGCGLWFKLAGMVADEVYIYSWAKWKGGYPLAKELKVSVLNHEALG